MNFILRNKKIFALIFWLWVAIIIFFTLTPSNLKLAIQIKTQTLRLDYFFHFMVYFSLAILYVLWKADNYLKIKPILLIYFLLSALILSGLGEYAQTYIPGRTFNPIDFYSNTAGIILGVIVPKFVLR